MNTFTNKFILQSLGMPILNNIIDISNELGLSERMIYILAKKNYLFYYKFLIDKRDGSKREISAPYMKLKLVQRWILQEILYKLAVSNQAMAFRTGNDYGIKRNAEVHRYNLYILEIDLVDFFSSISRTQVYYLFKELGYNQSTSNWFADICTCGGYLPQGAVTSPCISNIICRNLDKRLNSFCSKREILYTRYADDMTFSCDNKEMLKKVKSIIFKIITEEKFKINDKKTRYFSPKSHTRITGITIHNSKLKAPKLLKRKVRVMLHRMLATGDYTDRGKVLGYIAYIKSVEDGYFEKIREYIHRLTISEFRYNEEIVKAYNINKFYKDMPDMLIDYIEDDEYGEMAYIKDLNDEFRNKVIRTGCTETLEEQR